MRLAILGLGLIGGSVARALRERNPGEWRISAWSPTGAGPSLAVDDGVIDQAARSPADAIDGADVVLLAAPPIDCLRLIDDLAGPLASALPHGAAVTDVASTKRRIVQQAAARGLSFVGGHPMAGRETTGFAAADAGLFVGRPWVICADAAPDAAVGRVESLARSTGAVPLRMDPAAHDNAVAGISHLPLVVAAALVEAVLDDGGTPYARELAASGWRDMTRLALGDAAMGAGIAATNGDFLADRVRALRAALNAWLTELDREEGPDAERLQARFEAARDLLAADQGGGSG